MNQITPHPHLHANPEQQGLSPRPRSADPNVSWRQTHLLIAPLRGGLPGQKAAGSWPITGRLSLARRKPRLLGQTRSNNHAGALRVGGQDRWSPGDVPPLTVPWSAPRLMDPAPGWSQKAPRGRPRMHLSLGHQFSTARSGRGHPGQTCPRSPPGQSPHWCMALGRSYGNVHREKPEDAHKTFPHVGLGKLEGCGNVYPGLEALEK